MNTMIPEYNELSSNDKKTINTLIRRLAAANDEYLTDEDVKAIEEMREAKRRGELRDF